MEARRNLAGPVIAARASKGLENSVQAFLQPDRAQAADPAKALFWYRRARELGVAEAEQRIKALEIRPAVGPDLRPQLK